MQQQHNKYKGHKEAKINNNNNNNNKAHAKIVKLKHLAQL